MVPMKNKQSLLDAETNNGLLFIDPPYTFTGWAKKVIPLVHYITLYERYHFFGPPCRRIY